MKNHTHFVAALLILTFSAGHALAQTVKLAMGGCPPPAPRLIDLAALGVEYVEFQKGWSTVPGNEVIVVNGVNQSKWPNALSPDWIRRQFHLPVRGAKILVWDIEGPRFDGLHSLTDGAAYQRDLAWIANLPQATWRAIPQHKVWLYNPFFYPNNGGKTRDRDLARICSAHILNAQVDGSGMSAYSLYNGPVRNGPRDQWWRVQGPTVLKRLREGCAAYKLAHSFCSPEPETIVYINGIDLNSPEKSIVPDDELIACIRAAIEGGANRVCYWDATAYFWRLPPADPKVIAEQRRVIRCMRIAAGYEKPAAPPKPNSGPATRPASVLPLPANGDSPTPMSLQLLTRPIAVSKAEAGDGCGIGVDCPPLEEDAGWWITPTLTPRRSPPPLLRSPAFSAARAAPRHPESNRPPASPAASAAD
jgi:hypothetical protein